MPKQTLHLLAICLGVLFVLISVFGLTYIGCPTNTQYFIFRATFALGIALLALLITGFMRLRVSRTISAGGGFALFIVTFLFTPRIFTTTDKCNSPFSLTVFLRDNSGQKLLSREGALSLVVGDDLKQAAIDENGSCTFKDIPSNFMNTPVRYELNVRGWQFANRKIYLIDTLTSVSRTLLVEHDNSLCCVYGIVQDENGRLLKDVRITVENVSTYTGENGSFELEIPEERRKPSVLLLADKEKYKPWSYQVRPADKLPLRIMLMK
jgi:hypothetical protein